MIHRLATVVVSPQVGKVINRDGSGSLLDQMWLRQVVAVLAGFGVPGVPAETTPDGARIYPLVDDLQYWDKGWHVVLLGFFDDPAFYAGGNRELFDLLSSVDVRFTLDGVPLSTERTAIKRVAHTDPAFIDEAFIVGFGAFLPPGSLSLGTHELSTFQHDPVFGDEEFETPFTVVAC